MALGARNNTIYQLFGMFYLWHWFLIMSTITKCSKKAIESNDDKNIESSFNVFLLKKRF